MYEDDGIVYESWKLWYSDTGIISVYNIYDSVITHLILIFYEIDFVLSNGRIRSIMNMRMLTPTTIKNETIIATMFLKKLAPF